MSIREKTLNDLDVKKTGFSVDKIDSSIPKPLPRTYNHFLLITAKPRQGKTTLMYSLLVYRKSPYYRKFDKVFVFSPSLGTADKDKLKKLAPEQKYKELTLDALTEVYEAIEGSGERVLIIADDVVNDVKKNAGVEKMLCKMMMNRRHICGQAEDGEGAGLSMWMTTQVFNKMPRALRATAYYYILFKSSNKKELETLFDEVILLQKDEFDEMLRYVFNQKFNFLLIDTNEDYKNMDHKNLNKRLIFPHLEDADESGF